MEFNWGVANMERQASDDFVVTVHYRISAVDGEYTASTYGTQSFTPDPASPDFVAFEDLTEEIVLGWVKNAMDTESLEANFASQIEAQKAPVTVTGMPWAE